MNTNRTFQELQDAIRTEMQLDPGLIGDIERRRFLNDCLNDLATISLLEKEVSLPCVNGLVTKPDDFVNLILISWSDGRVLRPVEVTNTTARSSSPTGYVVKGAYIETYPKASVDSTVTLYYAYRPFAMVEATDRPNIPNGWDWLLVDYAVGRAHRKNGNIGLYREYMASYENGKSLLSQELVRQSNSRVTPTINQDYWNSPASPTDLIF